MDVVDWLQIQNMKAQLFACVKASLLRESYHNW